MTESAAGELAEKQKVAPSLLRSSLIVGVMTMLSRVLGLARDVAIAALAGASAYADAFFVAFRIPNFLRRLFAEGAFAQAFVPVLSEFQATRSFADVQRLVNRVCGLLGSSLLLVTTLAIIGAPLLTTLFAPGFKQDPVKFSLTIDLIRITFPYLFFISLTGFIGAILNSYQRFAVPAFTPVLLNVALIVAALWGVRFFTEPVYALAWGVFVAGVLQFLFQLPFLARLHLLPKPELKPKDEGVKKILLLMAPAMFGVSVSQINLLLDTVLASFLPSGSVSWLYYSDRLVELPLGVFAIAISTVILPLLSRRHAVEDKQHFARTLDWSVKMIFLISIPATVALLILAKPILSTLFFYGAMTEHDVEMARLSLQAYVLGLTPFMLIKVLAPGYFARQDTKTPVKIGIIAMVANMVLNIMFVLPFHFYWSMGHAGLALATSCSALLNAGLLWHGLQKQAVYQRQSGFYWSLVRAAIAAVLMGFTLYFWPIASEQWFIWSAWQRITQLAFMVSAGLLVYALTQVLCGLRLRDLRGLSAQ